MPVLPQYYLKKSVQGVLEGILSAVSIYVSHLPNAPLIPFDDLLRIELEGTHSNIHKHDSFARQDFDEIVKIVFDLWDTQTRGT